MSARPRLEFGMRLGGAPTRFGALALALVVVLAACASALRPEQADALDRDTGGIEVTPEAAMGAPTPRVETHAFWSEALGRAMPYRVFLPAGYDADTERRYPTLYLLHGFGANAGQWSDVGAPLTADRLIAAGTIAPLVIVMPEGENEYWVDHANGGPKWGAYTAVDLVKHVEATYRVLPGQQSRAIGGISMGAHGALQLALNYPGTFGVVGAHSVALRRFGSAPAYFGDRRDYEQRDPMTLVRTKTNVARSLALWLDIGDKDAWTGLAVQFVGELKDLRIPYQWHQWPGDHSAAYWSTHVEEYLRFYDAALRTTAPAPLR